MISRKQVRHIAKLARLGITKEEEKKFARELSSILDYFEKIKEVDVKDVEPTYYPQKLKNVFREDRPKKQEIEVIKKLIKAFPERKDSFLKVKRVLEK